MAARTEHQWQRQSKSGRVSPNKQRKFCPISPNKTEQQKCKNKKGSRTAIAEEVIYGTRIDSETIKRKRNCWKCLVLYIFVILAHKHRNVLEFCLWKQERTTYWDDVKTILVSHNGHKQRQNNPSVSQSTLTNLPNHWPRRPFPNSPNHWPRQPFPNSPNHWPLQPFPNSPNRWPRQPFPI